LSDKSKKRNTTMRITNKGAAGQSISKCAKEKYLLLETISASLSKPKLNKLKSLHYNENKLIPLCYKIKEEIRFLITGT
jgi:hypothetical protein